MRALSRDEVRSIDAHAIDTLEIPGVVLMENAGRNAAQAVLEHLGDASGKRVAIVAGAGNNGGDGLVVLRQLRRARLGQLTAFLVAPEEKFSGDAAVNLTAAKNLRCDLRDATETVDELSAELANFDLIVDAVGGTGIRGALRGDLATAVEQINDAGADVIAIDIPTGLDCDTGQAEGPAVRARRTVTFVARKKGFDADGASEYTGEVIVADIGIPAEAVAEMAGVL